MAAALTELFGSSVQILGSATGLHLVARFPGCQFSEDFFTATEVAGARFYPVTSHAMQPGEHLDELLLGYGNLSTEETRTGLAILAEHFHRVQLVSESCQGWSLAK